MHTEPSGKYIRDHSIPLLKTPAFDVGLRENMTFTHVSASYLPQWLGCHILIFQLKFPQSLKKVLFLILEKVETVIVETRNVPNERRYQGCPQEQ